MYGTAGELIRECREYAGLTQQHVADSLYLNVETVKSYELGRIKHIPEEVIAAMADLFLTPWLMFKFKWRTSLVFRRIMKEQFNFDDNHAQQSIKVVQAIQKAHAMIPQIMDNAINVNSEHQDEIQKVSNTLLSAIVSYNLTPKEKAASAKATNSKP